MKTKMKEGSRPAKANIKKALPNGGQISKTRVCIKNLPPSFTESDLRSFLIEQLKGDTKVTDCRILKDSSAKSRRMAFCGFLKPDQAKKCVERLHRSYCRSAKLMVEFAVLPAVHDAKKQQGESERGKDDPETVDEKQAEKAAIVDRKKQEFLAVMGVGESDQTTNRKFWANDDDDQGRTAKPEEKNDKEKAGSTPVDSDGDDSSSDGDSDSDDDADPLASKQSDMDFLRSKTVATDDLEDNPVEASTKDEPKLKDESGSNSGSDSGDSSVDDSKEDPVEEVEDVDRHGETPEVKLGNRLFIRNLPFSASEDDIREYFENIGAVVECHIPADDQKRSKGFGFVAYANAANAQAAMSSLDGTDFQGRIIHVLPARDAPTKSPGGDDSGNRYKDQMERKRKENAMSDTAGWSASFVRGDAVVDNLSTRLGLNKGDIMAVKDGLSAGDAAVRLALGETAVIEENRSYFSSRGYDMDALVSANQKGKDGSIDRCKQAILVKNLPHDTKKEELLKMFGEAGEGPSSILLPPSRTIAVVEYRHGNDAKSAFRKLAYRRFKSVPLYLEWAPLAAKKDGKEEVANDDNANTRDSEEHEELETQETLVAADTSTLYIKNLNFKTTEDQLRKLFSQYGKDLRSVRIPRKAAPIKRGRTGTEESLSMGFGFVEFGSQASASKALKLLNGKLLDGHALEIKPSGAGKAQGKEPAIKSSKNPSKLMIRNVPFQATRKELLQLFGSFGQLKKVRMPRKFDGTNRGFAFVEFLTGKEAAAAMKALSKTHLYGRHLVIEWAATDEESERIDGLREKAERDVAPSVPKNKRIRFNY